MQRQLSVSISTPHCRRGASPFQTSNSRNHQGGRGPQPSSPVRSHTVHLPYTKVPAKPRVLPNLRFHSLATERKVHPKLVRAQLTRLWSRTFNECI